MDAPVAVVTGASAGVGRAVARELAERGYAVGLVARGSAGLAGVAREVEVRGGTALAVEADVADWTEIDAAADRIEDVLGPIDVWVNNAMTTVFSWSWDIEADEYRRATEVTYLGVVHGTLAALDRMRPRDHGRIINVGSALAYLGIPLQAPYCASKFAVRGFSQCVRAELVATDSNVSLSEVHLPAVNTTQFDWCLNKLDRRPEPVDPIYSPDSAARAVVDTVEDGRWTRVFGVWNRAIVIAARVVPGVAARFGSMSAVEGQQGEEPADPDRPNNLWDPVDVDQDHGAAGRFGDRSQGMLTPSFLASVPATFCQLAAAVVGAVRRRRSEVRLRSEWV